MDSLAKIMKGCVVMIGSCEFSFIPTKKHIIPHIYIIPHINCLSHGSIFFLHFSPFFGRVWMDETSQSTPSTHEGEIRAEARYLQRDCEI